MKRWLAIFGICLFAVLQSKAQVAVTNLSGTATYGSLSVTVTSTGGVSSWSASCLGTPAQYWVGMGTSGAYNYQFSRPVYRIKMQSYALNGGEYIQLYVNGLPYVVTMTDVISLGGGCPSTSSTVCSLSLGRIYGPATGMSDYAGPDLDIKFCDRVDSFKVYCMSNSGMTYHMQVDTVSSLTSTHHVTASSSSPVCEGANLNLYSGPDTTGLTYSWTGPAGYTAAIENPTVTGIGMSGAGTYTVVTALGGCKDTAYVDVVVKHVPVPIATNNSPICSGEDLHLFASDSISTATFQWSGPGGFTSALQNPIRSAAPASAAGTYQVVATVDGCTSFPATTNATIYQTPVITNYFGTNPTPCEHSDGSFTLTGFLASTVYYVSYVTNGTTVYDTITTDASGNIVVTGLPKGIYHDFYVTLHGCVSNMGGPVELTDPGTPPKPVIKSNAPVCLGQILDLYGFDSAAGVSYTWDGPAGFHVVSQNAEIIHVTAANSGVYTLTVANIACKNSATETIVIQPSLTLIDISPSRTIAFGNSTQLEVQGAQNYWWTPNDGSLDNPNINNPVATPQHTTIYQVIGMNHWGCTDTATVTVTVVFPDTIMIPTGFTPNDDGMNDEFKIINPPYNWKMVDFTVCNRWGQIVFQSNYNMKEGWNGKLNGVPQDMDVYHYVITLASPDGVNHQYKGDVTLVR